MSLSRLSSQASSLSAPIPDDIIAQPPRRHDSPPRPPFVIAIGSPASATCLGSPVRLSACERCACACCLLPSPSLCAPLALRTRRPLLPRARTLHPYHTTPHHTTTHAHSLTRPERHQQPLGRPARDTCVSLPTSPSTHPSASPFFDPPSVLAAPASTTLKFNHGCPREHPTQRCHRKTCRALGHALVRLVPPLHARCHCRLPARCPRRTPRSPRSRRTPLWRQRRPSGCRSPPET